MEARLQQFNSLTTSFQGELSLLMKMAALSTLQYALNDDLTSLEHDFVGSSVSFQFGYNNVHQLTGLSLDDNSFLWEPSASATTTYTTANDLNQYPSVGGTNYGYDGNGCLTRGPSAQALTRSIA